MSSPLLFWISATAIIIVTLGVLVVALLRRRPGTAPAAGTASVALFRDQKRQLEAERAAGELDAGEYAREVDELAHRLGAEIDAPAATPAAARESRAPFYVALLLVALIPLSAALMYLALGRPAAMVATQAPPATGQVTQAQVEAMVATLAQRMKDNPADPKGWRILARSYAGLGRFDDAARAYAEAAQRGPDDADVYADWAEALAMTQGQSLAGKPAELLDKALAIDPRNRKALALAGSAALERRDPQAALRYWRALAQELPPGTDDAKDVAAAIAELEHTTGTPPATPATAPNAATNAAPASPPQAASTARLTGRVELAPSLASRVHPDDVVFVFARAVNGPRMPLAVLRFAARELPRAFTLDDSLAMAPGMTLSAFPSVVLEARVAKGGIATPASGDLVGQIGPLSSSSANIRLVIDHVLP
ncbi:MAG: c-type cytochrome biogenesis protein CcmI [Proteobacteria bacterium]|nr:c-type cytochrome biogenesis protein CcmI [Pseudomonadota bacterium]